LSFPRFFQGLVTFFRLSPRSSQILYAKTLPSLPPWIPVAVYPYQLRSTISSLLFSRGFHPSRLLNRSPTSRFCRYSAESCASVHTLRGPYLFSPPSSADSALFLLPSAFEIELGVDRLLLEAPTLPFAPRSLSSGRLVAFYGHIVSSSFPAVPPASALFSSGCGRLSAIFLFASYGRPFPLQRKGSRRSGHSLCTLCFLFFFFGSRSFGPQFYLDVLSVAFFFAQHWVQRPYSVFLCSNLELRLSRFPPRFIPPPFFFCFRSLRGHLDAPWFFLTRLPLPCALVGDA